jgi:hypothetical protein
MVDLVTSQAPHANLTEADIRGPYNELSAALSKTGDAFEATAKHLATVAGLKAVTVDPDGTPHVDKPPIPIVGDAAESFNHALKVGAMAEGAGAVRRAVLDLRQQYANDPEGFLHAYTGFRETTVQKYKDAGGPELGAAIGSAIDDTATMSYRALLNAHQRASLSGATTAIVKNADQYADDLTSLASHGVSDSPQFQSMMRDYTSLLRAGADNPLIPLDRSDADDHIDRTVARAKDAAVIGNVRRAYAEGGPGAATKFIDDTLTEPHDFGREIRPRAEAEIDNLKAADDHRELQAARAPIVAQETRYAAGVARLSAGSLDQTWLDRNAADIGPRNAERLREGLLAPGAPTSAPTVSARLIDHAIGDPATAPNHVIDALSSGLISRDDAWSTLRLASAVDNDAKSRPWANEIRKDVQARSPSALGDVNMLLNQDGMTAATAEPAAAEIVDKYLTADRKRAVATLPLPASTNVARDDIDTGQIKRSRARLLASTLEGQSSLADFAAQHRLLTQWQQAVAKV